MINLMDMSFKLLYLMDEVTDPAMTILAEGLFGGPKSYLYINIINPGLTRAVKINIAKLGLIKAELGKQLSVSPFFFSNVAIVFIRYFSTPSLVLNKQVKDKKALQQISQNTFSQNTSLVV